MTRAIDVGLVRCGGCNAVCDDLIDRQPRAQCHRCGRVLTRREAGSLAKAWALLVTAMVLYVPANLLPVMHTRVLDRAGDSTIMAGVIEFWKGGQYGIAAIVFVASIVIPCAKFVALAFLLVTTQCDLPVSKLMRARLHRAMESVSAWSMLDVLVVGWVVALSNFDAMSDAEPRVGIVFFGLVVVFTLLSSKSLDTRLIWDGRRN